MSKLIAFAAGLLVGLAAALGAAAVGSYNTQRYDWSSS